MPTHILAQTFETFVHYVGNDFVEYRLLTLVEQGVFAMKGDTNDIFLIRLNYFNTFKRMNSKNQASKA